MCDSSAILKNVSNEATRAMDAENACYDNPIVVNETVDNKTHRQHVNRTIDANNSCLCSNSISTDTDSSTLTVVCNDCSCSNTLKSESEQCDMKTDISQGSNDAKQTENVEINGKETASARVEDNNGNMVTEAKHEESGTEDTPCKLDIKEPTEKHIRRFTCGDAVVVFAAFMCQMIAVGWSFSLGLLYVEWLEEFKTGKGQTAIVPSLSGGIVFGAGVLAGMIVNKIGHRKTIIIGSVLASAGIFGSSFATGIPMLIGTIGVATGCGFSLVNVASLVAVGKCITKGRSMATAVAKCGVGVGAFVSPQVMRPLIEAYGWRVMLQIYTGASISLVLFGLLLGPGHEEKKVYQNVTDSEPMKPKTKLFNLSIFRDSTYVCFVIAVFLFMSAIPLPSVMLIDYGMHKGYSKATSTLILSCASIGSTVGRAISGFLRQTAGMKSIDIFALTAFLPGIALMLYTVADSYATFVTVTMMFGVSIGFVLGIYAILAYDVVGLERYASGVGFASTAIGIGNAICGPVAGVLTDSTGSYDAAFFFTGCMCCLSSIVMAAVRLVKHVTANKIVYESKEITIRTQPDSACRS